MKKVLLWVIAFLVTAFVLVYQRMTGPTYPYKASAEIAGAEISSRLPRTHVITSDCEVSVPAVNPEITGYISYKRFKTDDEFTPLFMQREGENLIGYLPKQPMAGKLAYQVILEYNGQETLYSGKEPIIIRFKGEVPMFVVLLHVIVIFLALLFSTRTGLEALKRGSNPRKLALWTTGFLTLGGMILGPIMQKFAFDAFWTGFPFGTDLTDNKTIIALIGWIIALIAGRKGKPARGWILGAAILLLIVFLIPHSVLGSEFDYSKMENEQVAVQAYNQAYIYLSLNTMVTLKDTRTGFPFRI